MRREDIRRLLPAVYRTTLTEGGPLLALLGVMEALHAPSEEALRDLDAALDPRRAPDRFVPFLATWVDLAWLWTDREASAETAVGQESLVLERIGMLRELVASAAYLSQWRGTSRGLRAFLERATGSRGFEIEEEALDSEGRARPFHLRIRAPASAAEPRLRALITRVVEMEKPAYATYELTFEN
jgi:phage tail-like protein